MPQLEVIIRCRVCEEEVDCMDLSEEDPATNLCEVAGDLIFKHKCTRKKPHVHDYQYTMDHIYQCDCGAIK